MGASFSNWNDVVDAAYYTGYGSGEAIWLWISIILCVISLFWGHTHERKINDAGH